MKIIGAVYRQPDSNLDLFNQGLDADVNSLSKSKAELIITGKYNIYLLKHNTHDGTDLFINSLYSHSLLPLITRPTRCGLESSSLIDNIFTNNYASLSRVLI